jgi:hypothetical protein
MSHLSFLLLLDVFTSQRAEGNLICGNPFYPTGCSFIRHFAEC